MRGMTGVNPLRGLNIHNSLPIKPHVIAKAKMDVGQPWLSYHYKGKHQKRILVAYSHSYNWDAKLVKQKEWIHGVSSGIQLVTLRHFSHKRWQNGKQNMEGSNTWGMFRVKGDTKDLEWCWAVNKSIVWIPFNKIFSWHSEDLHISMIRKSMLDWCNGIRQFLWEESNQRYSLLYHTKPIWQ